MKYQTVRKKQVKYNLVHTKQEYTPKDEIKPNPQLLLDIIASIGAVPEECVYIGDSEMKDIEMAQNANVSDVFAKYGTGHFEKKRRGL
ncbi:HAD family hydrolase [Escherichia coli]|uniref:HAD family hydrolase n=1 Tax=Escherichia coli TaxID=562 RepID=UPI002032E881|nr:HAD-IA family hydrolase [Escherichia coli]